MTTAAHADPSENDDGPGHANPAINDHAPEFDAAFIHWWVEDECHPPDLGESTPHDDLVSFKAMLDRHGLRVVRNGSDPLTGGEG